MKILQMNAVTKSSTQHMLINTGYLDSVIFMSTESCVQRYVIYNTALDMSTFIEYQIVSINTKLYINYLFVFVFVWGNKICMNNQGACISSIAIKGYFHPVTIRKNCVRSILFLGRFYVQVQLKLCTLIPIGLTTLY